MSVERPTMRDLYEGLARLEEKVEQKLDKVPTKTEMRLTVALAVLGGSSVASIIASVITRTSPPEQVQALAHLIHLI